MKARVADVNSRRCRQLMMSQTVRDAAAQRFTMLSNHKQAIFLF